VEIPHRKVYKHLCYSKVSLLGQNEFVLMLTQTTKRAYRTQLIFYNISTVFWMTYFIQSTTLILLEKYLSLGLIMCTINVYCFLSISCISP